MDKLEYKKKERKKETQNHLIYPFPYQSLLLGEGEARNSVDS